MAEENVDDLYENLDEDTTLEAVKNLVNEIAKINKSISFANPVINEDGKKLSEINVEAIKKEAAQKLSEQNSKMKHLIDYKKFSDKDMLKK